MTKELLDSARTLRAFIEHSAEALPDADAANLPEAFPQWAVGKAYVLGDRVRYQEKLYAIIQPHTSQSDWTPDITPALWREVTPEGVIPEWQQPVGAHDAYMYGDVVMFNGTKYVSTADTNVWQPGTFGWELFTD